MLQGASASRVLFGRLGRLFRPRLLGWLGTPGEGTGLGVVILGDYGGRDHV